MPRITNEGGYEEYPGKVWIELQYHNQQIYLNFSFFIKISLAIAAGLAYGQIDDKLKETNLILGGVLLEYIFSLWTSVAIIIHVGSKIRRYGQINKPNVLEMFAWGEFWMIVVIWIITSIIGIVFLNNYWLFPMGELIILLLIAFEMKIWFPKK